MVAYSCLGDKLRERNRLLCVFIFIAAGVGVGFLVRYLGKILKLSLTIGIG